MSQDLVNPITRTQVVTSLPVSGAGGETVQLSTDGKYYFWNTTSQTWEQMPRQGAQTGPAFEATRTSNEATAINEHTVIYGTELYDTDSAFDPATGIYTVKTPGWYVFTHRGHLVNAGDANRQTISIWRDPVGATTAAPIGIQAIDDGQYEATVSAVVRCDAGDLIYPTVFSSNQANGIRGSAGATYNAFSGAWLGGPGQTVDERGVPAARMRATVNQSLATSGTVTKVAFDTSDFDTDGMVDLTNERFNIKTPGVYDVQGAAFFASNATGVREVRILVNGSLRANQTVGAANNDLNVQVNDQLQLAAGDYVEIHALQTSGGALNLRGGDIAHSVTASIVWQGSGKTVVPYAKAYHTVAVSIANNSYTTLALANEIADNDGIHDNVTNNSRLTCRTGGVYLVQGLVAFASNTTGGRGARILKNGADDVARTQLNTPAGASGSSSLVPVTTLMELAVGDYIELQAWQESGGALNTAVFTTGVAPSLSMVKVGQSAVSTSVVTSGEYVTALPASPTDKQEIFYAADEVNGVIWHLRYRAESSSAYKWEYVGGPPLLAEVTATVTPPATGYPSAAQGGPDVTVPLAGDYDVTVSADHSNTTTPSQNLMSYYIGATVPADADSANALCGTAFGHATTATKTRRKTGLAAGVVLSARYRTTNTTASTSNRRMMVVPVRVG